jgi:hypothetical protein
MRKTLPALAVLSLMALACASAQSKSGLGRAKAQLTKPEFEITQLGGMPSAARHVEGAMPVHYQLRVANRAGEPITLKMLTVQSMGAGAYTVSVTSRPFDRTIQPDQYEIVEMWVPAFIEYETVMGANGPVTLRGVAEFDSPVGQFQEVFIQQVNAMPGRGNVQ